MFYILGHKIYYLFIIFKRYRSLHKPYHFIDHFTFQIFNELHQTPSVLILYKLTWNVCNVYMCVANLLCPWCLLDPLTWMLWPSGPGVYLTQYQPCLTSHMYYILGPHQIWRHINEIHENLIPTKIKQLDHTVLIHI